MEVCFIMIRTIYARAATVLARKPFKLWGLSLLSAVFISLATALFGIIPGVALGLGWLLSVSMTMVFLHGYLGEDVNVPQLFECFRDWATVKRVLCGMGYMSLWIFLWCLIPIVGPIFGIIRAYEYALTPYILMMEPEVPITEAYKVSSRRTNGFKGKMFWADILWVIPVVLVVIILGLLAKIPYAGALFSLILGLVVICAALFSNLFIGLVRAAFYVEIQRRTGEGPQFDDSNNNPVEPERHSAADEPRETDGKAVRFCPMCGSRNEAGAKFCVNCGSKMDV